VNDAHLSVGCRPASAYTSPARWLPTPDPPSTMNCMHPQWFIVLAATPRGGERKEKRGE